MKSLRTTDHRTNAQSYSLDSAYPFTAIVGQAEMKLALVLNAVDPLLGGVLIMGHRGTGKSTAVRALASLLPQIPVVADCSYRCDPTDPSSLCEQCHSQFQQQQKLPRKKVKVAVVELPLGATEDRVCGSIDIQRALTDGAKSFEPGLLARANRGFLYIDEVNLLEDHLVDLLLDVAMTGRHKVERESISIEHPARFVLIGSGNPEEGELRPQLLDRFGVHVVVATENDLDQRVAIVERRELFESNHERFLADFAAEQESLRKNIVRARTALSSVRMDRKLLRKIAELCNELKLDGHRGELTIARASRALAALNKRRQVTEADVKQVAPMSVRHRLRREPFAETGSNQRINRALEKVFGTGAANGSEAGNDGENDGSPGQTRGSDLTEQEPAKRRAIGGSAAAGSRDRSGQLTGSEWKVPPSEAGHTFHLGIENLQRSLPAKRFARQPKGRGNVFAKPSLSTQRGRYIRSGVQDRSSRIAVDATLRSLSLSGFLLPLAQRVPETRYATSFPIHTLRYKQFSNKLGALYILAIDGSGSMAPQRISRARAIAVELLRKAYLARDSVAIVVFRGAGAEVVLPPSRSTLRAKRALDELTVGGGTPLSAGVICSLELAQRSGKKHGEAIVLLFTDGHANISLGGNRSSGRSERKDQILAELSELGRAIATDGTTVLVVDTENGFRATGAAREVAESLGARMVKIGEVHF